MIFRCPQPAGIVFIPENGGGAGVRLREGLSRRLAPGAVRTVEVSAIGNPKFKSRWLTFGQRRD